MPASCTPGTGSMPGDPCNPGFLGLPAPAPPARRALSRFHLEIGLWGHAPPHPRKGFCVKETAFKGGRTTRGTVEVRPPSKLPLSLGRATKKNRPFAAPRGNPRQRKNPSLEAWRASKKDFPSALIAAKGDRGLPGSLSPPFFCKKGGPGVLGAGIAPKYQVI